MSIENREEFFFEVFKQLHFPFFAIDLYALARLLTIATPGDPSHFRIRIPSLTDRRASVVQAFRALFQAIDVPPVFSAHFEQSKIINNLFGCRHAFGRMVARQKESLFAIHEADDFLVWEEQTAWPIGYSTFLSQLMSLFTLFERYIEDRQQTFANATGGAAEILDQTSRVFPTRFHYAFASLGAWAAGTVNLQYFSYYATQPLIREMEKNKEYAVRIGYSEADAKDLTDGGLVILPASLASAITSAQGSIFLRGSG